MKNKSKISERLKELRNEKGMTQEELADKINGARSTIAMYEKGDTKPSLDVLVKLSQVFNCSIDYLMGRADLKTTEEYLKNVDLTSVYLDGVYDGEKKWKDKIKAKIEENKWAIEHYNCDEADYKQSQAVGAWHVLQCLLKESEI